MRIRFLKTIAPVALLLLTPALVHAGRAHQTPSLSQPTSSQDESRFTLQGKINKVEAGKFTVNTEENILFHVRYDEKTSITRADGSAGSSKDLRVGVVVEVEGDLEESGEIRAVTIKLQEKEPPKH